jgi:histidyl-tRNA synthetase
MQDVLPEDRRYWDIVIETGTNLARRYGFHHIDVPVIEYTNLFARGMGEASDVFVQKEMYTIEEPDGSSITMRPEFTAGLVRAYIENGMASWPQPVKLFTVGPIFRRERPQAGRYRQHSQFDVEILGETDPAADLEVMMLAMNLYRDLGYKGLTFQLNSTGCPVCKPVYIEALKTFLAEHEGKLAAIDQERLQKNPLRVLDSKEAGMEALLARRPTSSTTCARTAPVIWPNLRGLLDALDQRYTINFRLVRGIDYYTKRCLKCGPKALARRRRCAAAAVMMGWRKRLAVNRRPASALAAVLSALSWVSRNRVSLHRPPRSRPCWWLILAGTKETAVSLTYQLRAPALARLAFARENAA